jgi:L-ascorbate metabolism protein UlaG (beta-lactamase superfamily)
MPSLKGRRLERALASRQFRGGRFHNTSNLGPELKGGSALPIISDLLFGGKKRVPQKPLPVENPVPVWKHAPTTGLRATWFGHSTLLLEIDGVTILTDPVFGPRASPFFFTGRTRFHPPPAKISQLPPLDAVLLSHDHYDHLNTPSIRELAQMQVPFITSLGVGVRLERLGVDPQSITELDWWEEYELNQGSLKITAAPAQHFSGRGVGDRNATLWSSWALKGPNHNVFFSGDTGLTDELSEIGRRLGPFDLMMLEIGASHPAWADIHLGPVNALRAFEMLGGGTLLPIHWSTFDLALHKWDEPAETLLTLAAKSGARIVTPPLGRPIEPAHIEAPTPWWRNV